MAKRASAVDPLHHDYTKAVITHWAHDVDANVASGIVESRKMPLENRVWYSYPGQTNPAFVSAFTAAPATIARVLDDGSSQVYRYEYNSLGKVTRQTDPLGRETIYNVRRERHRPVRDTPGQRRRLRPAETRHLQLQHQPLTITDAAGQTTTYTYNTAGQMLTMTTPARAGITENRTTTYSYDTNGYFRASPGPATGATTSLHVRRLWRVRTVTDSEGYVLTTDYDALDVRRRSPTPTGRTSRRSTTGSIRAADGTGWALEHDLLRRAEAPGLDARPARADDDDAVVHVRQPGQDR